MPVINLPRTKVTMDFSPLVNDSGVIGNVDGLNVNFNTPDIFLSGTLEVYVDGRKLTQLLDYTEYPSNDGFLVVITPDNPLRITKPFKNTEEVRCKYIKA